MAKRVNKPVNTGTVNPHTFDKDLVEDITGKGLAPNVWTQARNATPNTTRGDLGELSNEQSNKFCAAAPYKIIGIIHIDEDKWAVFSTDNTDSEIGLFKEGLCEYETIVNDQCLNFSDLNLIKGQAKENFDCSFELYWDDGNNPTRSLNIDDVPWIEVCVDENNVTLPGPPGYVPVGCVTCTPTTNLDCDAIRLAPLVTNPCFTVEKGPQGGEILNGSYFAVGAYVLNDQRITGYSAPSNVQSIFDHSGIAGSLDIIIDDIDTRFDEFELVIVEIRNLKPLAKKIGIYNTRQKRISIDAIDERYPTIDIPDIAIRNPVVDKSDAIFRNGDYLIRTGPTDKFDFNYQPLANQIGTEWISVEYPSDYYRKGGNRTNYMRDEVYSFFIRWVYDTGDKSPSFHIPGRYEAPGSSVFNLVATDALPEEISAGINYRWAVENTAAPTSGLTAISLPDGGVQISKGTMAYWESTERYDDDNPDVWDASSNPIWGSTNPAHDLCGKQIRHHKFPDNTKGLDGSGSWVTNHHNAGGSRIRVMGVQFSNIKPPLDNDGNVIENIVGYEILRGTREGNKSITAKGIINNMRTYVISGGITTRFGLYPNYPYNPTTGASLTDKFITAPGSFPSQQHFTFHSPDTNFRDPFLSAREIVNYGEMRAQVNGKFEYPDGHPEHQLLTNFGFMVALIGGIGYALIKKHGTRTTVKREPMLDWDQLKGSASLLGGYATGIGPTWASPAISSTAGVTIASSYTAVDIAMGTAASAADGAIAAQKQAGGFIGDALLGVGPSTWFGLINGKNAGMQQAGIQAFGPVTGGWTQEEVSGGDDRMMPTVLNLVAGGLSFAMAASEGAAVVVRLIKSLTPTEQYALQYNSHGFYNDFSVAPISGNRRRSINEIQYLDDDIQDFGTAWRINNLYRGRSVALETQAAYSYCQQGDNTQQTVASAGLNHSTATEAPFSTQAVSYYTALKQRLRNQYGQLEGIIQVPVSTCMTEIDPTNPAPNTSEVLFGGDTYIGRYTEKNSMFFFYNWLNGQPDESEFDYQDYEMIPRPTYWMDTYEFDINEWIASVASLAALISGGPSWPSDKHELDCGSQGGVTGWLIKKNCYMYLFNSGIRDFFVESEVNLDYRDWGDEDSQRHYDPYRFTDVNAIFNSGIIKSGNFYKYDYSLSVARLYSNVTSWGNTHRRSYDPTKAEECFVYRPNRAIYSLRQDQEKIRDYWKVFLPNNFKDFKSRITAIKPVNRNGAMILFENESPVMFQGVDQLTTDDGTKLTIGDGGLFAFPQQNILNTDDSYEYGSCQNRLSVVNTASGVFWMSQNQGKIFQVQNGIKEISAFDNKWWLSTYLPYLLTQDPMFANNPFELTDNPVAGIGCQTIYDNESQLIYFCKRDFFVRSDIADTVSYVSGDDFLVNDRLPIKLGDPDYFRDASWTISYDPKTEGWIGYHDWHPDLLMPGKSNFLSIKDNGIWKHNDDCQSYCNFYGEDYPFEVEYAVITPQVVNTLRSVEYYMEVYKYDQNCYDRFHVLDFNFDEAVIYNSEQCSGLLRLNLAPKNNAPEILNYPNINPNFIDILYDKVEQKYRFNQFWDITADRGEFNPLAERAIWNTEPNGYIRNLNPNNLNYNKIQTERKKFRHFKNTVLLRRRVSGNRNMLVSIANNKNLMSPR